jgi:uncharacterized protein (DUF433 family)
MAIMTKKYIEKRDNTYYLKDTRISLDSVIYAFLNGVSPEAIAQSFPLLNLEQIYGAITYYLGNKIEIDRYLEEGELLFKQQREASLNNNQLMIEKINNARRVIA